MKHLRITAVALVAVLAIAAALATSASAAGPEWGQCYAKAGGKYSANCLTKVKGGGYEWRKGADVAHKGFTGEASKGTLNAAYTICGEDERNPTPCEEIEPGEDKTIISVECSGHEGGPGEQDHGETSGKNKVANVSVTFRGCVALGSIPCANTPNEGEVQIDPLAGELGTIETGEKVGLLLTPKTKKGEFAKFSCAGILSSVVGEGNSKEGTAYPGKKGGNDGIISTIGPINRMTTTLTQEYTINAEDENQPTHFTGKAIDLLESYLYNEYEPQYSSKWSKAGETVTAVNTPEEEGEIKAP